MELSQLVADPNLENEGVWFPYRDTDIQLRIAYINSKAYEKALNKAAFGLRKTGRLGDVPAAMDSEIQAEAMFNTILKGWKNITQDGKEVAFNRANCIQLLTRSKELRDFVGEVAVDVRNFQILEGSNNSEPTKKGVEAARAELKSGA